MSLFISERCFSTLNQAYGTGNITIIALIVRRMTNDNACNIHLLQMDLLHTASINFVMPTGEKLQITMFKCPVWDADRLLYLSLHRIY